MIRRPPPVPAALAALAVAGVPVTAAVLGGSAAAQAPAPTVTATVSGGALRLTGAGALVPGRTRFAFRSSGRETDLTLFAIKAGATEAQVIAAAAKLQGPPTSLQQYGAFVLGASPSKGHPYTASLVLTQTTYLLVDTTKAPKVVARFTVGAGTSTGAATAPDARVQLRDFRFAGARTLPATGTIRFTNAGRSPHFAELARARSAAAAKRAAALLVKGKEKQAMKLLSGSQTAVLGLISPGVSNDVEVKRLQAGSYLLACFYGDERSMGKEHTMLGMVRVVEVR